MEKTTNRFQPGAVKKFGQTAQSDPDRTGAGGNMFVPTERTVVASRTKMETTEGPRNCIQKNKKRNLRLFSLKLGKVVRKAGVRDVEDVYDMLISGEVEVSDLREEMPTVQSVPIGNEG